VRGRFPFETLKRKVMEIKARYGSSTLLIEDSPISRGLIQSLREKSINVTPYRPETDKVARVIAQTDLFAGGSIQHAKLGIRISKPEAPAVGLKWRTSPISG
jgi:phage terminase large subunit-like protein